MKQKKLLGLLVALLNAAVVVKAQPAYYPDTAWQSRTARQAGMNRQKLDSAIAFALVSENKVERDLRIANMKAYAREPGYAMVGPMKERGGPAGLIIKNGYIVAEYGDISRVDMTFSATKSFLTTVAGLAVDEGLIKNVNDQVNRYVWDDTYKGVHNSKITWKHLLNQSSNWSGTLFGLHDWADRPPREGGIDDWKNRTLLEPGTVYEYNDVRVNLLAYSLLNVYRRPLPMVLKEKLMDPIGASTTWRWYGADHAFVNIDGIMMQSITGGGHHGGGLFIHATDMARFGLLFLRKGKWNGKQLLSEKWIREAHQPSTPNKEYGYMWWINTNQGWTAVSKDTYYAAGFGGNYIVVDNANDLVVVTRWMDDSKMGAFMKLVIESIENK